MEVVLEQTLMSVKLNEKRLEIRKINKKNGRK